MPAYIYAFLAKASACCYWAQSDLPEPARARAEKELAQLQGARLERERKERERKLAVRYHKVLLPRTCSHWAAPSAPPLHRTACPVCCLAMKKMITAVCGHTTRGSWCDV
jgi:hypothetical protein